MNKKGDSHRPAVRKSISGGYGTGKPPRPADPNDPIETVVFLRRPQPKRTQTNPNSLANLRPRQKGEPRANQGMRYKQGKNREQEKIDLTIMAAVRRQLESSPQLLDEGAKVWLNQYKEGDYRAREQLLDRLDGPVPRETPQVPPPIEFTLNIGIVNKNDSRDTGTP